MCKIICSCWSNPPAFPVLRSVHLRFADTLATMDIAALLVSGRRPWQGIFFTVYHLRQTIFEQKQSKTYWARYVELVFILFAIFWSRQSLWTKHVTTNFRHVKPQPLLKDSGSDWSMDIPGRTVQNQTAPVRTSRRGNRRLGFHPAFFYPHLTMQMWQSPFIYVRCQVLLSPQIRDV